ncbi:CPBP family intramembrane metalloprotease [Staphylococcus gallinarum]|uniref:CAAX protease family protein n=2 Tax=Staphylococcus gallinarum TaxID=1293 RepID=A0A380SB81_STAGA|nr:CPBP family intramembrane glutamic endopeptidase [Staphylococcus gallinarum]RTX80329.1 CPBP family intramembrane metalloprotease [Staphylococcus gallinarum]GEQ06628.1 CAAX protease family protein [Staphylococcus gallinarum]SUQ38575.1 caax amino protease family protein; putative membrane protein [Staphylococcus gallinarum]
MKENSIKFVLLTMITSLLFILVFFISKILPFTDYANHFLSQCFVVCMIIIYIKRKHRLELFQFNLTNFIYGLWLGSFVFIIIILNIVTHLEMIKSIDFTVATIFLLCAYNITIGVFEELIYRGLIFNAFLENNRPIYAAWMSSIIFGIVHLLNLTHNPDYVGAVTQVIYAIFLGMLFAAIYYVTQNLWSVIILHSMLDISSGFYEIKHIGENFNQGTTSITLSFITIIILLPILFIGIKILKNTNR